MKTYSVKDKIVKKKIYKMGLSVREFCDKNDLNYQTIVNAIKNTKTPSLLTSLKLQIASRGEITLIDLMSDADRIKFKEWGNHQSKS